jgi:hypothetical protein
MFPFKTISCPFVGGFPNDRATAPLLFSAHRLYRLTVPSSIFYFSPTQYLRFAPINWVGRVNEIGDCCSSLIGSNQASLRASLALSRLSASISSKRSSTLRALGGMSGQRSTGLLYSPFFIASTSSFYLKYRVIIN